MPFISFCQSFRSVSGMAGVERNSEFPPSGPNGALLIVHSA